jgi:hypothetical protein
VSNSTLLVLQIVAAAIILWWIVDLRLSARFLPPFLSPALFKRASILLLVLGVVLLGPLGGANKFAFPVAAVILALVVLLDLRLRALAVRVARVLGPDGAPAAARLGAVIRDVVLLGLAVTIAVGRFMAL